MPETAGPPSPGVPQERRRALRAPTNTKNLPPGTVCTHLVRPRAPPQSRCITAASVPLSEPLCTGNVHGAQRRGSRPGQPGVTPATADRLPKGSAFLCVISTHPCGCCNRSACSVCCAPHHRQHGSPAMSSTTAPETPRPRHGRPGRIRMNEFKEQKLNPSTW